MITEPCYDLPKTTKKKKYSNEEIEIIIRFIEAFNKSGRDGICDIVECAIMQYDRLKEKVINAEV